MTKNFFYLSFFWFIIFLIFCFFIFVSAQTTSEELATSSEELATSSLEELPNSSEKIPTSSEENVSFPIASFSGGSGNPAPLGDSCFTVLEDDFESYNLAALNGQGSWVGNAGFLVQNSTVYHSSKAIKKEGSGSSESIIGTGDAITDGQLIVFLRRSGDNTTSRFHFGLLNADSENHALVSFKGGDKKIQYYSDGSYTNLADYVLGEWYQITIQWRSSDGKSRYQVNEEGWTSWVNNISNDTPTKIYMDSAGESSGDTMYYDYIICELPVPEEPSSTSTEDLIENTSTGAWFWIHNSISYGDILIIFLLLLIFLLDFIKFIFSLEIPTKIK